MLDHFQSLMYSIKGFPRGRSPWAPTETMGHLSRLSDDSCSRVWGKTILLFIEINPVDLQYKVSGLRLPTFPDFLQRHFCEHSLSATYKIFSLLNTCNSERTTEEESCFCIGWEFVTISPCPWILDKVWLGPSTNPHRVSGSPGMFCLEKAVDQSISFLKIPFAYKHKTQGWIACLYILTKHSPPTPCKGITVPFDETLKVLVAGDN